MTPDAGTKTYSTESTDQSKSRNNYVVTNGDGIDVCPTQLTNLEIVKPCFLQCIFDIELFVKLDFRIDLKTAQTMRKKHQREQRRTQPPKFKFG